MSNTKTLTTADWDIRVRGRNLRDGVLTDKDVEKQLAALPDLEEHVDSFSIEQPALGGHEDDEDDEDLDVAP